MRKHAILEGSYLNKQQNEKLQELFMRRQQFSSQNSNDLGYCDKIKHQIKHNKDALPFRRSYYGISSDEKKREGMKKVDGDLEEAK